jgi:hypothetical protein
MTPTAAEPRLQFATRSIKRHIGETVADAVCTTSNALTEYYDGGLRAQTKVRFGELIARLYSLRQCTAGYLSFNDTAEHYGKIALRERLGPDASEAALHEMISWLLDVLARLVRKHLH